MRNANASANTLEYPIWLVSGMLVPITALPALDRAARRGAADHLGRPRGARGGHRHGPVWPALGRLPGDQPGLLRPSARSLMTYVERRARAARRPWPWPEEAADDALFGSSWRRASPTGPCSTGPPRRCSSARCSSARCSSCCSSPTWAASSGSPTTVLHRRQRGARRRAVPASSAAPWRSPTSGASAPSGTCCCPRAAAPPMFLGRALPYAGNGLLDRGDHARRGRAAARPAGPGRRPARPAAGTGGGVAGLRRSSG